jgi:hypothetical protein
MALPDVRLHLKTLLVREALRVFDERLRPDVRPRVFDERLRPDVRPRVRSRVEADAVRSVENLPDAMVLLLGALPDETLRRVFHACLSIAAIAMREGVVPETLTPIQEVPEVRDRQDPRGV